MKKNFARLAAFLLAVWMLFCATSCANIEAKELSTGYERRVEGGTGASEDLAPVMADFAFELFHRTLSEDGENDLISPLSAMLCLALVTNGADGETLAQIEESIGMDVETLNQSLYAYTSSLAELEDCKVEMANSIWFRDDGSLKVKEEFLQVNADWYDAQVYGAPFDSSTVRDVNSWVKKHTDGMIDSIIEEIDPLTVMYLINALVFDAKWQNEYEKSDIKDRTFFNFDGSRKTVDMMYSEEGVYLEGEGFSGFAKSYKGNAYSFVGLLPNEDSDVYRLARSLDGESWQTMWESRLYTSVDAGIPEFTYDADMDLTEALKDMGMTDMFLVGAADFSKLGESSIGNLYCSSVQQKTFIDVNRHGTKAAAVTWADLKCGSAAPMEKRTVILDRPFVYAIVDNQTGIPIFLGAVSHIR